MKLRGNYKKGAMWGHLIKVGLMALSVSVSQPNRGSDIQLDSPESLRKGWVIFNECITHCRLSFPPTKLVRILDDQSCRVKLFSHTVQLSHFVLEAPSWFPVKNTGNMVSFKQIFVLFLIYKGMFRNITSDFVWETSFKIPLWLTSLVGVKNVELNLLSGFYKLLDLWWFKQTSPVSSSV